MSDGGRGRAVRAGGAVARRNPHDRDAADTAAEDGLARAGRSRCVRTEARTGRGGRADFPDARRQSRRARRAGYGVSRSAGPARRACRDNRRTRSECDVLQAALQQFYAERIAAPEMHIPIPFPAADAELLEGWLSGEAGRRVRLVVPKRGEKRGLLELASRNAQVAYQARFNENVAAHYDALETLRVGARAAGRAAADRVLRHLDHPGQRNRRLDGRLRRRPDEAIGVPEVQNPRRLRLAGRGSAVRIWTPCRICEGDDRWTMGRA